MIQLLVNGKLQIVNSINAKKSSFPTHYHQVVQKLYVSNFPIPIFFNPHHNFLLKIVNGWKTEHLACVSAKKIPESVSLDVVQVWNSWNLFWVFHFLHARHIKRLFAEYILPNVNFFNFF